MDGLAVALEGLRGAHARLLLAMLRWWQLPASEPIPAGIRSLLRDRNEWRERVIQAGGDDPDILLEQEAMQ